jgi:hypothetical protein
MKRFYARFRIMLMTFTLGLASFWVYDGLVNGVIDKPVNLPVSKSEVIFVVFPGLKNGGGSGCGTRYLNEPRLVPTIDKVNKLNNKAQKLR